MRKGEIRNPKSPRLGRWFLSRILPRQLKSTAYGDYEEIYRRILKEDGKRKARRWYWKHVLWSALPFMRATVHWRFIMIKEYLKLTLRHIKLRKGTAFVNIGGLAVGLASCILVFFFIRDELSYDRFHTHIDSIYEVKSKVTYQNGAEVFRETEGAVVPALIETFEEVEAGTRLAKVDLIVQTGKGIFKRSGIGVDSSFFDVFSFPLAEGGEASALGDPSSVVLNPQSARLLFGLGDPMGQIVTIKIADETLECRVTGVTEDVPANSSLKYDLLLPISLVKGAEINQWNTGLDAAGFIRLKRNTDPGALEAKFEGTVDTHLDKGGKTGSHYLFPFAAYHRGAGDYSFSSVLEPRSSPTYSLILTGIALLVLLVAGLNFLNLSIAVVASGRIKEIGLRKVLGAGRKQLSDQFRFEGMFMSLASLVLGLAIAQTVLPVFNRFAGKALRLDLLGPGAPGLVLVLFSVLLGILAGSYPGRFLLRVQPVHLFRGKFLLGRKNSFNRIFLLFQFGISIFLVITTGFLYRQHRYLLRADLGFNPENVVVLNVENMTPRVLMRTQLLPVLKSRLLQYPDIESVSGAYSGMSSWSAMITQREGEGSREIVRFNEVDHDFGEALGLEMSEGRWFSSDYPSDRTNAVIINQTLVEKFNIEEPTGKVLSDFSGFRGPVKIIGVVRDFHFDSLHQPIEPAFLALEDESFKKVYVRLKGENPRRAVGVIEKEFTAAAPGYPFLYSFLDDELATQYEAEKRWSLMVTIVCIFSLFIAGAGVFALALRAAARRTKEIGVRKVLGASIFRIVALLAGEFTVIAGTAVVIAWPAALLTVSRVLADSPYRTPLSLWVFAAGGAVVIALTLATVGLHAVKAAVRNPVESLRHE